MLPESILSLSRHRHVRDQHDVSAVDGPIDRDVVGNAGSDDQSGSRYPTLHLEIQLSPIRQASIMVGGIASRQELATFLQETKGLQLLGFNAVLHATPPTARHETRVKHSTPTRTFQHNRRQLMSSHDPMIVLSC